MRLLPDLLGNGLGNGFPARVQPGDTILVHAGLYKYDRYIYTNDLSISTVPFDGTYYLTASGTPEKPIAIKAAGDGEVVFDGNGAFNLFNVKAGNYTYFEGLTIRNTEIAIWAGTQFISGSKGLTVKRCRFEDIGMGVYSNYSGSGNFYIADNYFIGRNDPKHLISWAGNFWAQFAGVDGQVFPPKMASYIAVKVYGSGNVIAYNYVANFHDGIDNETYGNPDGSAAIDGPKYPSKEYWDRRPVSLDYYNNYMTNFHDNAFEIDGSMHNVRVMRNMMINNASQPYCNQPAIGGPVYWIRNISFNSPGGSTRLGGGSGILFYNNTMLAEVSGGTTSNTHFRNNLILAQNSTGFGGPGRGGNPGGEPPPSIVFGFTTYTNYSSSDYNGFSPNANAPYSFQWNSPAWDVPADYASRGHNAQTETRRYKTLQEYQQATKQDAHSAAPDQSDEIQRHRGRGDAESFQSFRSEHRMGALEHKEFVRNGEAVPRVQREPVPHGALGFLYRLDPGRESTNTTAGGCQEGGRLWSGQYSRNDFRMGACS